MNRSALTVAVAGLLTHGALAQEAMTTQAATMPTAGAAILRQSIFLYDLGSNPLTGDLGRRMFVSDTSLQLGLDAGWSLLIDAQAEHVRTETPTGIDSDDAFSSIDITAKYRFYMNNRGGIDTERAALLMGLRIDTEDSVNADPHIGVVYTRVAGRHGINAELTYTYSTGDEHDTLSNALGGEGAADSINYNLAYVYRVLPAAFTAESTGAWYVTAELLGLYETNGDNEIRYAPGLMFEGRSLALEVQVQLPLVADLEERPELKWAVGVGLRWLF
ncbi:MAG: hypothetical protein Q8L55_13550 [Phycisphaerales bacterium]|nr:hypothetical protein [Phycisphaerales bacterium]